MHHRRMYILYGKSQVRREEVHHWLHVQLSHIAPHRWLVACCSASCELQWRRMGQHSTPAPVTSRISIKYFDKSRSGGCYCGFHGVELNVSCQRLYAGW
jgi:hypothetical protein